MRRGPHGPRDPAHLESTHQGAVGPRCSRARVALCSGVRGCLRRKWSSGNFVFSNKKTKQPPLFVFWAMDIGESQRTRGALARLAPSDPDDAPWAPWTQGPSASIIHAHRGRDATMPRCSCPGVRGRQRHRPPFGSCASSTMRRAPHGPMDPAHLESTRPGAAMPRCAMLVCVLVGVRWCFRRKWSFGELCFL